MSDLEKGDRPFEVKKSFGMDVLLKITKNTVGGIETSDSTDGKSIQSNLSVNELSSAVDKTIYAHGIKLKPE